MGWGGKGWGDGMEWVGMGMGWDGPAGSTVIAQLRGISVDSGHYLLRY